MAKKFNGHHRYHNDPTPSAKYPVRCTAFTDGIHSIITCLITCNFVASGDHNIAMEIMRVHQLEDHQIKHYRTKILRDAEKFREAYRIAKSGL